MVAKTEMIPIHPQPKRGLPFRISFANRGQQYWYNERDNWARCGRGDMLFEWKCPFGTNGKPVFIDGKYYWERTE